MQQVVKEIRKHDDFEPAIISMQSAKNETTDSGVLDVFVSKLRQWFKKDLPPVKTWKNLSQLFVKQYFDKSLILILDEFDSLHEDCINKFANKFRDMYLSRHNETDIPSQDKHCLLHGLALVGVRSVLGIENITGSPFNVQRSLHIPNLTFKETEGLFTWYEKERGQKIEYAVIERIFYETQGQPGLTCWFGELLTEVYNKEPERPLTKKHCDHVIAMAVQALLNNTVLNIISKAKQIPYKELDFGQNINYLVLLFFYNLLI